MFLSFDSEDCKIMRIADNYIFFVKNNPFLNVSYKMHCVTKCSHDVFVGSHGDKQV